MPADQHVSSPKDSSPPTGRLTVALAALPGATLPGDLPASRRWFAEDLTDPWEIAADGTMAVRPPGRVRLPPTF